MEIFKTFKHPSQFSYAWKCWTVRENEFSTGGIYNEQYRKYNSYNSYLHTRTIRMCYVGKFRIHYLFE